MSDERKAFLRALAENEDDTTTRLVYADWLDERGEHEEADRQRKWPAAKAWLVRFCRDNGGEPAWEQVITYEDLIELARRSVEEAGDWGQLEISCGTNETMCDALRENSREFWANWSIVTGIPVAPDLARKSCYSCRC